MTKLLKLYTEYCAVYVDDLNLSELAETNPALWARKMWQYVNAAIPLFDSPPGIERYLRLTEPTYDSYQQTVSGELPDAELHFALGAEYEDFEIVSARCAVREEYVANVIFTPLPITYDKNTGTVTVARADVQKIPQNCVIDIDFYKDGAFAEDLPRDVLKILGLCFNLVWQTRFNNDWLSNVSKPQDKTFAEQNRANKMRADTEREEAIRRMLYAEIRTFEQNAAYKKIMPQGAYLI